VIRSLLLEMLTRRRDTDGPDPRWVAFARGLALGALAGAAIAGSSIWSRRRRS